MARKSNNTQSLLRGNWDFVRGQGMALQAFVFILVFGILGGGGYLALTSFASTSTAAADLGTCQSRYSKSPYMHQGIYNNTCAAAAQRFLGATERMNSTFVSKCPSKWKPKAYSIGYLNSNSIEVVDGDFGPNTADYVRCWQHYFSLTPDAIIGPNTWASMAGTCGATRAIRESYAYYGVSCKN